MSRVSLLSISVLLLTAASAQESDNARSYEVLGSLQAELWGADSVSGGGALSRVRVYNANGKRISQLVKAFPELSMVYLHPTKDLRADDFRHLKSLPDLKVLWVTGFLIDDYATVIAELTSLEELRIYVRGQMDEHDLMALKGLAHLKTLHLGVGFDTYSPSDDQLGASVIGLFPRLEELSLNNASVSDNSINAASRITNLKCLRLSGGDGVSKNGYQPLERLRNLETLQFYMPRSDDAVGYLESLSDLQELEGLPDITDTGMLTVGRMQSLKRLHNVSSGEITDQSWSHLGELSELESLELHSPKINGSGISEMRPLKKLKRLNLRHTEFHAKNINSLLKFRALESLDLGCTKVEDSDWESLVVLKRLPRLLELSVELSEPNRLKLQGMLPNVVVSFLE